MSPQRDTFDRGETWTGEPDGFFNDPPLDIVWRATLRGDYTAAGTGLAVAPVNVITIDGVPAGAQVVGGFLFWAITDSRPRFTHARVEVNDVPVYGTPTGVLQRFRRPDAYTYRATLSRASLERIQERPGADPFEPPHVGNGSFVLSGFPNDPMTESLGATLALVYERDDLPARHLIFFDGAHEVGVWDHESLPIQGFLASPGPQYRSTFVVGLGSPFGRELAGIVGAGGAQYTRSHAFAGREGRWWDTEGFARSGAILSGALQAEAEIRNVGARCGPYICFDVLVWTAQLFSVTTSLPTDRDPSAFFRANDSVGE